MQDQVHVLGELDRKVGVMRALGELITLINQDSIKPLPVGFAPGYHTKEGQTWPY